MQKITAKLKNTPLRTSQAGCSVSVPLNKEETPSVAGKVLTVINPEVNQRQRTGGSKTIVCVISIEGKPLMPCKPAKARHLLESKKARVFKMYPFTIQLNFVCENQVQDVTLGIDAGFINVGFSAVTASKELVAGTLILDSKTSSRLTEKRMYRRGRRNKLWYRKPRFNNRKKNVGWLPPSTQRRYDAHLKVINLYKNLLPITKVTIETANFDIQKINNPEIAGEGYQQGDMYEYQNMRSYLMAREKGLCQLCKKQFSKSAPSHIHHCKQRSEAGSNRPKNLAILHKKCHVKLHAKNLKLSAPKSLKPETFMSIIQAKFRNDITDLEITFGYKTFVDRNALGLEKNHFTDAFVIAGGTKQERCSPIVITQKHRNNRAIQLNRKGFKPSIRKQRYAIQPKDLIWIYGQKWIAKGIQNRGKFIMIERLKNPFPTRKIEKTYNFGSFAYN